MNFKNRRVWLKIAAGIFLLVFLTALSQSNRPIRIGSKHFNESYILAEIIGQLLEDRGFKVERNFGLGGTMICYQALVNEEIDVYPEYSGTIEQAILKLDRGTNYTQLQTLLRENHGLELLDSFGFNNTYALAVRQETAKKRNLETISDLRDHKNLRLGFSYEFMERGDGWQALAEAYSLPFNPTGMEHGLAYQGLNEETLNVIDVYSTDAEIERYNLTLLEDNKDFFPEYMAAPLVRLDLDPNVKSILEELAGKIGQERMQALNAQVAIEKKSFAETAHRFLQNEGLLTQNNTFATQTKWQDLARRTVAHIKLTGIALLVATGVAIPLGIWIYRLRAISQPVMYFVGLMQTVPSIALLALMIPLFGIGVKPAIVALIIYALLPILRNTFAALNTIEPELKKVSVGMGLTVWQRLRYIEIPLAVPNILAGIRTAAVISIGTATLAAFIGAGGLGEPIVTGLSLNDPILIMWGAIPAAVLAILVELMFEALERAIVPKHLLQKQAR
ncbi:ABC transporter permease subunit [candidate division KSB1 bacterium]|nr:ABC transporter permease subunit [candidate division KSB1 bacterium]NIR69176.1 ABC transporter permease subunit [candidate division KSB1 bacterium]NIS25687.1 ABC transporter permease subunit [candidate division KSB1 bacterium]NIT72555.1 ABC transporter permease subunit [candidate division KSB1 bacterium]NIU26364.1 ABC transporter permease subunit [candidate division KSB1 bacterium]